MNTTIFVVATEAFTSADIIESSVSPGRNTSGSGLNELSGSGLDKSGKHHVPSMSEYCSSVDDVTASIPECHSQYRANYSRALSYALIGCIAIIMLAMGCNVRVHKLMNRLKKPWGILIGFLCQFGIMPLSAFLLALLMRLSKPKALVVLIMGCLPGGTASNLITYWLDGDMDLSIAMTTTSTVLAFAMMPLCLFIYSGSFADDTISVPYANICILLVAFVIPVGAGILINHFKPNLARVIAKVGAVVGLLVITAAAVIGIVLYPAAIHIPPIYWGTGFILPLIGYILGYALSHLVVVLFGNDVITAKQKRTVAIETGTQNSQLCTTIIQLNYGCTCMILEMYSYPLVYFMFQIVESLILCFLYQIYNRIGIPSDRLSEELEMTPRTPPEEQPQDNERPQDGVLDTNANTTK